MARVSKKNANKNPNGAPKGFSDSAWNKLSDTWRTAAQSMKTEELEQDIIRAVRVISAQTSDMKNDAKLKQLSEDLKLLKSGYTELIGEAKAQIEFCIYTLNDRGMVVKAPKLASSDEDEE
jgi:hypothetical protein